MLFFEKFFGLIELETGGIILSWIGIVLYSLNIFGLTVISIIIVSDKSIIINKIGISQEDFLNIMPFLIFIVVLLYIRLFLGLWASKCLLNGIKKRDHKQVHKYVVVDKTIMILSVLAIFSSLENAVVIIFWIYLSICTHNLYNKLKKESKQGTVDIPMTTVESVQNDPQVQPGYAQVITYQQPQPYSQVPPYQLPQPQAPTSQLPQAYQQPPTYQETKSAEANH